MDEWCLLCHKVTRFDPVSVRLSQYRNTRRTIPGLWHCSECGMVIFKEVPVSEEEKKAARERAELLEGFD
jgi:hypothetical protein